MEIVAVADLKLGMFVVEPDCPWSEFPFALQGFVLTKPEQVALFQQKCRFVQIDRSRSVAGQFAAPKQQFDRPLKATPFQNFKVEEEAAPPRRGPLFTPEQQDERQLRRKHFLRFLNSQNDSEHARALSREFAYIEPRYDELANALQHAFQSFTDGRDVDVRQVREGVREIAGSLQRNADAVMWLLRLKQRDEYSFDHAMDVSVNMILLGSHIGWRDHKLHDLGMAGLMQDVGKVQLPSELLTKRDVLTDDERTAVRSHVASSLEILYSQADLPQDVVMIVARHHERWDGSGYPLGLRFEQIGTAAEIAGLSDAFCAMLRDKPYRSALGHQEALEELHALRGKQFGPTLMEQFVQCVGLYPIGTMVELSNGEVGVVIQQNRVQRARPRVVIMLDDDKSPVREYRVVDLRDERHAALRVRKALPHNAYGLASRDYYLG